MAYILYHAAALAALGFLFWLPGLLVERLALTRRDLGGLRQLVRWCLGLGCWMAFAFALNSLGLFGLPGVAVGIGGLLVVAGWAAARGKLGSLGDLRPRVSWKGLLPGLGLAAVLLPAFLWAMSPQVSWDADVYHLTLPRLYLEHGGFRPVEMSVYSSWPLNTELLFGVAMAVSGYPLAKLVHFGFGLLVCHALAVGWRELVAGWDGAESGRGIWGQDPSGQGTARRAGLALAPWTAMALVAANDVVAFELRAAYVDLAQAFFAFAGLLFLLRGRRGDRFWLLLAGISCGLAAGIKVSGFLSAVALGGVLVLGALASKERRGRLAGDLAGFGAPVVLLLLPWVAKAWWATGNPVYPFLHGLFGGPDWSAALAESFAAWQRGIGMGRSAMDYLLLPVRVVLEGGRGYQRFGGAVGSFWIVLVPLACLGSVRNRALRPLLGTVGLGFVLWAASSQQARFLIPLLPPLALAAAASLDALAGRLPTAALRPWAQGAFFAAALALAAFEHRSHLVPGYRLAALYQARPEGLAASVVHPAYRFVNEELLADGKLLMLHTNRGFFCRREYLADSFFEASQIADWLAGAETPEAVRAKLEERGVTHVLLEHRPRGARYPGSLARLLADPSRAETLFRSPDGRFTVLRLR